MFKDKTILLHTLGCKLNFAESATLADAFAARGAHIASKDDVPDFIIVNTCSVTDTADKKCRREIRALGRKYPAARIVVMGCYAQLKPEEVSELDNVMLVTGNSDKNRVLDLIEEHFRGPDVCNLVVPSKELKDFSASCSRGDRTRYFLKVQDGCDYYCTYCTIPMARGRSRSGTIEETVAQAREVAHKGGREIVITGVNIGDFGKRNGETFLDLCRALDEVEGIERYRISSIEPNLLTDDTIDFVASSKRFMPHFHIPLQSGSDEVLRLMHRKYDTALFASKIARIRSKIPDAFIGVDLIVGARGETDELFQQSKAFVESLDISRLHVFTYSERPGTKALEIATNVSPEVKHERTRQMLEVSRAKLLNFISRFKGTVRPVLVEGKKRGLGSVGFTDNYLRLSLPGDGLPVNGIVKARIGEVVNADAKDDESIMIEGSVAE